MLNPDRPILRWILVATCLCVASCREKNPVASPEPAPSIRNILLVTIDTLRADALSVYGGPVKAPAISALARQGAVFEHAFTSAPITLPAHTSLMSGLIPPAHGVRNNGTFRAPASLKVLAEYAREHGLATAAIVGAFPLASQFGLNQGFDFYDDRFAPPAAAPGVFLYSERNAEDVRKSAEKWVDSIEKPYFLWLHFFDPHHPYVDHGFPELSPYHNEVAYVDREIGLFLDHLKSGRKDDQTLIVVTSDHGESFGEHGEISHTLFVYNTTLRIPLILNGPGIPAIRRPELARIVDVMPTIADALGWKLDSAVDGASLLPVLKGTDHAARENYAETFAPALDFGWSPLASLQDLNFKYIRAPRPEFYDLNKDPGETKNISAAAQSPGYRERLMAMLSRAPQSPASHTISAEEREQLASLGYVSGGSTRVDWNAADPKDKIETAHRIARLTAEPAGLPEKAREYASLVASEPRNPLLLLRYAEVLLRLQRYGTAQATFQKVLDLGYPAPSAYNGLATTMFYQKNLDDAEEILSRAIRTGVADGETFYNMAELQFQHGDREAAFREYDRSMEHHYAEAFYRKARLLDVMGRSDESLRILERAAQEFPNEMRPHFESGMIHSRRRAYDQAIAEFQHALQSSPGDAVIYYNIGICFHLSGNEADSRVWLERFLKEAPDSMKAEKKHARELLASR